MTLLTFTFCTIQMCLRHALKLSLLQYYTAKENRRETSLVASRHTFCSRSVIFWRCKFSDSEQYRALRAMHWQLVQRRNLLLQYSSHVPTPTFITIARCFRLPTSSLAGEARFVHDIHIHVRTSPGLTSMTDARKHASAKWQQEINEKLGWRRWTVPATGYIN